MRFLVSLPALRDDADRKADIGKLEKDGWVKQPIQGLSTIPTYSHPEVTTEQGVRDRLRSIDVEPGHVIIDRHPDDEWTSNLNPGP
jgi:hypothetical protein